MVPKNRKINNETVWYQQRRYTWTSPVHVPTFFSSASNQPPPRLTLFFLMGFLSLVILSLICFFFNQFLLL